jgi:hypothetical protein
MRNENPKRRSHGGAEAQRKTNSKMTIIEKNRYAVEL